MAKMSANRRRLMHYEQGQRGAMNPPRSRGNWVVSGQGANQAGTPVAYQGWGGSIALLASGVPQSLLLVALPTAAAATGQPTIGQVEIAQVGGKVTVYSPSATANYGIVCSLYIAELNSTATAWSVRDPSTPGDATRDDYLYLESCQFSVSQLPNLTSSFGIEFLPRLQSPIRIGGGQALCMTVAQEAGVNTVNISLFLRALVKQST